MKEALKESAVYNLIDSKSRAFHRSYPVRMMIFVEELCQEQLQMLQLNPLLGLSCLQGQAYILGSNFELNVSLTLDPRFEFVTIASRSSFNNFKEIVDPSDSLVGTPPVIAYCFCGSVSNIDKGGIERRLK